MVHRKKMDKAIIKIMPFASIDKNIFPLCNFIKIIQQKINLIFIIYKIKFITK